MFSKALFPLALGVLLSSVASAFPQTSVVTDPVGFTTASCQSGYDTYVAIPFTRPPEFTGTIQSASANTLTVNGSPGWGTTPNQFVYASGTQPKTYYVLIGAGGATNPKEGHLYAITANGSNTLSVATTSYDDLTGVLPGTQITIIPYWTPATIFPASDAGVSFTPTTSTSAYKTELRIPAVAAAGAYSYPTTYFYSNHVDGSTSGWRVVGDNTTDHGDDPLLPDTYFVVRNDNGAPTLPLTALGSVLMKRLAAPMFTSSSQSQDNPLAMVRPVDVSLNQSGLGPADRSFVQGDQLLLFASNQITGSQVPSATYIYDTAWRMPGDTATDHGADVIPPGTAMLVRKATANSGTRFWVNSPTYASGLSIRPVQLVSRLNHNGVGPFDVDLYTVGNVGVEPRRGGTTGKDFTLVATFPLPLTGTPAINPLTSADGLATADAPSYANVNGRGVVTVNLHNVSNAQTLSATLTGLADNISSGNVTIPMGVLLGDTTGDGLVNSADASQTKARSGQAVQSSNFRSDVTLDGTINSADASLVKSRSGTALP